MDLTAAFLMSWNFVEIKMGMKCAFDVTRDYRNYGFRIHIFLLNIN